MTFAATSPAGVHVPGLPSVTGTGATITSASPFVFVNTATGALVAGWYRDQLTWAGDRLLLAHRVVDRRAASPVPV